MHRFKDLKIWKISRKFCGEVYLATKSFPDDEKFGLTNQMRRSAVSIPSNIAEGSSRISAKEFSRFLDISFGSCYELETQLLISSDLGYLEFPTCEKLLSDLNSIVQMTNKFRTTLKVRE